MPFLFLDLHTHRPALSDDVFELENLWFGQAVAPRAPFRSAGLHPWRLSFADEGAADRWLREQAALPAVLAVGEAGLDKVAGAPLERQWAAFRRCIAASEAAGKPLVLHCVRAFDEILAEKKRVQPTQPWIFHGFAKNTRTAERLWQAGCYTSFGAAVFRENGPAAAALCAAPADRFFLETDEFEGGIRAVYDKAAALLGGSPPALQRQMARNFQTVFGFDPNRPKP